MLADDLWKRAREVCRKLVRHCPVACPAGHSRARVLALIVLLATRVPGSGAPLSGSGLYAVVNAPSGAVPLADSPGQTGTRRTLANGTIVWIAGMPENGWVPIQTTSGAGWLPAGAMAAITDTYMPSAEDQSL